MAEKTVSPFWRFSLAIYRLEGVPPACLKLQDLHGVDVNVMLFGLWLASTGRALARADMRAIVDAMDNWKKNVVVPLRGVRRLLKDPVAASGKAGGAFAPEGVMALRDQLKAIELEAERLQQEALFALRPVAQWGETAEPVAAARGNLDAYAGALGATFDSAAVAAMLAGFEKAATAQP